MTKATPQQDILFANKSLQTLNKNTTLRKTKTANVSNILFSGQRGRKSYFLISGLKSLATGEHFSQHRRWLRFFTTFELKEQKTEDFEG